MVIKLTKRGNKMKNFTLATILTLAVTPALAEEQPTPAPAPQTESSNLYGGFSFHNGKYSESGLQTYKATAANFTFGQQANENLGFEVRGLIGLSGDKQDESFCDFSGCYELDLKVELDYVLSLFLKPQVSSDDGQFTAYALIGISKAKLEAEATAYGVSASVSESDNGISYGVGFSVGEKDSAQFLVEYVSYIDSSDWDYKGINLGVQFPLN